MQKKLKMYQQKKTDVMNEKELENTDITVDTITTDEEIIEKISYIILSKNRMNK